MRSAMMPNGILLKHRICRPNSSRTIFSKTKVWDEKYTPQHRKDLELFWKQNLNNKSKVVEDQLKYYVLSMFPYPSGKLHMGHVRVYTISDVMARYNRLLGYNVIHPMGWDAFGLPAENAAIERNIEPAIWTKNNIEIMKRQLSSLGCQFDWDREVSTCSGSYYKWTQYLFIKLFNAGLVYQKMAPVNWDPLDKTVLADEQVDDKGRSWRSGAKVEKVLLKQWYIKTTAYSESLIDGLNEVDEELWKDIISLQRNWIGVCNGVRFYFKLKSKQILSKCDEDLLSSPFGVFTRHPEAIYGASHVIISPEHILNLPQFFESSDMYMPGGVQKLNVSVVNPFTGVLIPIFVSTEFPFEEYLDHHIGIPSISDADRTFALKWGLEINDIIDKQTGLLVNSSDISGMSLKDARSATLNKAKSIGVGGHVTSAKARDWLISRQRYWGTPIPIVHCPKYGVVPVAEEELPVLLPKKMSLSQETGNQIGTKSPLANNSQWLKTKCSKCDCEGHGMRETDTMDTFVDSSWYFLRYLDPRNDKVPFDKEAAKKFMPVDIYIGGKEHATMHLYYARFLNHFLFDCHLTPSREPFKNLLTQGMVLGQSFKLSENGKYLRPDSVERIEGEKYVEKGTGRAVTTKWEKMSKSKFNGVDPQEILDEFGCDATRICILSNASPKSDRPWSTEVFVGVERWQRRLWNLVHRFISIRKRAEEYPKTAINIEKLNVESSAIDDIRNKTLLQVIHHMDKTFLLNTAISRMQMLSTEISKSSDITVAKSAAFERALSDLIIMLSPIAPMFTSELWSGVASVNHLNKFYDWESNVLDQKYPKVDDDFRIPLTVKVNNWDITEIHLPMVYSEIQSKLTSDLAWNLISFDEKFLKFMSSVFSESEVERKQSAWDSEILHKKLTKFGNYKAEFEITLSGKSSKKLKTIIFSK